MIGMMLKDLYIVKGMGRSYLVLLGLFIVLTATGVYHVSFVSGMFMVVLMMIPLSVFAYDEQAGWDKFAVATPAGRRGVVRGRYLLIVVLWLGSLAFTAVLIGGLSLAGMGDGFLPSLASGAATLCAALVLLSVLLPILFKFGSQKSRVVMMIVVGVSVGGGVALSGILSGVMTGEGLERLFSLLAVLLPVIALGGLAISYFTSLSIYQKKEL